MNRIVLIGNGFDKAHRLPTGYNDFIDFLWGKIIGELKLKPNNRNYQNKLAFIHTADKLSNIKIEDYTRLMMLLKANEIRIEYKNEFFKTITERNYDNWVDIEWEYNSFLVGVNEKEKSACIKVPQEGKYKDVESLNKEFQEIKDLLEEYLISDVIKNAEFNTEVFQEVGEKLHAAFDFNDFALSTIDVKVERLEGFFRDWLVTSSSILDFEDIDCLERFRKKIPGNRKANEIIKRELLKQSYNNYFYSYPEETLLLSFNYTDTHEKYNSDTILDRFLPESKTKISTLNIHGSLKKEDKSPIIFGYGDELEESYSSLEKNRNDNYLENIKSVKYLESKSYRKLLEFIETDYFQVLIIGHSCGISDRTLLNTIFEHDNCASIKPYYFEKALGDDNYSSIVKNITRNFNDKRKLRERVVNKTQCEPLVKFKEKP